MFKKVNHSNGKREIFFCNKKIFEYVKSIKFANFVESRFNQTISKQDLNIFYDVMKKNHRLDSNQSFYAFRFLLSRAHIAYKYHKIFYDFYLRSQNGESLIFIDGGCHNGVFSDIALACGGVVYAFEPNVYLCAFLRNLYQNNPRFILSESAISTKNAKTIFYNLIDDMVSQGASIVEFGTNYCEETQESSGYEVEMIDFCAFVREIVAKHGKIHFIKLDIEGAEFEVLEAFIAQDLYKNVEYIMVETHERLFDNPNAKITALKAQIADKNITNIYLDWE